MTIDIHELAKLPYGEAAKAIEKHSRETVMGGWYHVTVEVWAASREDAEDALETFEVVKVRLVKGTGL